MSMRVHMCTREALTAVLSYMPNPPLFADRLIGSCMRDGERHLSELYRGSQQRQTTLQQMENAGASGLCV